MGRLAVVRSPAAPHLLFVVCLGLCFLFHPVYQICCCTKCGVSCFLWSWLTSCLPHHCHQKHLLSAAP